MIELERLFERYGSIERVLVLADLRGLETPGGDPTGVALAIACLSSPDATRHSVQKYVHAITGTLLRSAFAQPLAGPVVLVPVLRAGMAMWPAAASFFDASSTAFVACAKSKGSAAVTATWLKTTPLSGAEIVVLDPIIAHGDTVRRVCEEALRRYEQVRSITVVACYASPEGVAAILADCPRVRVAVGCMAETVGADGFVIPRINGDMGDKLFGP